MEIRIPTNDSSKLIAVMMSLSQYFPECLQDLMQLSHSCPDGITMEILPTKVNHTGNQRRYYWKWVKEFAKFTGNTPDEMHEHMLGVCYGNEVVNTKLGLMTRPQQRSSESSRLEYSELIETMIRISADFGFVVPPAVSKSGEPFCS